MPDRISQLYEQHAAKWIAARGTRLIEADWLERFTAGLTPGATVLDLGCGSGHPIRAALLARGFAVTGVDTAPSLIEHAKRTLPRGEWIVADMRTLAVGRRFDAVLAWHSFFHLRAEDQRAMFPIFSDHASPGAPLMFNAGPAAGEAWGEWQGEPLHHASLAPHEYGLLLEANGFDLLYFTAGEPIGDGPSVYIARKR